MWLRYVRDNGVGSGRATTEASLTEMDHPRVHPVTQSPDPPLDSKQPLRVWLHGAGMSAQTWGHVDGVALDLPGHGTAPRLRHANVPDYARALTLPAGDLVLIGHSLGGMVAAELAAQLGNRCKALILLDAPLWLPCGPFLRFAEPLAKITSRLPGPRGIAPLVAWRTARGPNRRLVRQALSHVDPKALRDAMLAVARYDARPIMPKLSMPILAVWAAQTLVTTPQMQAALAQAQPSARQIQTATGHMMHFDDREGIFASIDGFLTDNGLCEPS